MEQTAQTTDEALADLSADERRAWVNSLKPQQLEAMLYGWRGVQARPEQLPPDGDWSVWIYMAGRGAGKTRSAAEWVHERAISGRYQMGALVAPTPADARDFCIEGPSGLLNVGHPQDRPIYTSGRRAIEWRTGFRMLVYSAEDPDQVRGPNVDTAWATELGSWPVAKDRARHETKAEKAWSNLEFTLRVGPNPQCVIDTTPRPMNPLRSLLRERGTVVTRGTTYSNRSNLSPKFLERILKYEGTRIGRQELQGELLEDVEGALWSLALIESQRCPAMDGLDRIVVGVDPPGDRAECGIVVAGRVAQTKRCYVLDDRSTAGTPVQWGKAVIQAFDDWKADLVVAETNFGGPMVAANLRNLRQHLPIKEVHASRGKIIRAEPISTLYENGTIWHAGVFPMLEDQLTTWVPGMPSPDRLDALVWAMTELHGFVADWIPGTAAVIGQPLAATKAEWSPLAGARPDW
jgi:phage terminase large subunit-like protein